MGINYAALAGLALAAVVGAVAIGDGQPTLGAVVVVVGALAIAVKLVTIQMRRKAVRRNAGH